MKSPQEMVREFHRKYGFYDKVPMGSATWEAAGLARADLILEELQEMLSAWREKDRVALADGLADLLYVVYGTAVAAGIDVQPVFEEVHASNMTKDAGGFKPAKGASYRPPDIKKALGM